MSATDDSDDAAPELPEPEPRRPESPGFATWTGPRDNGPPPYEESAAQVDARKRYRAEADLDSLERRRKRVERVNKRREAAAARALARRFDEAGGGS